jgi:hypothetical protein
LTLRGSLCSLSSIYSPPDLFLPLSYLLSTFVTKYKLTSRRLHVQSSGNEGKLSPCALVTAPT